MTELKATKHLYAGVRGKTIIDHRIRLKLGLTMEEYAIMDVLTRDKTYSHSVTEEILFQTGVCQHDFEKFLVTLNSDSMDRWKKEFDVDQGFFEFWEFIYKKHGNRADAQKKYAEARKLVDKDYLHERARKYIATRPNFPEYTKAAEVYLNPKKKHWEDLLPGEIKAATTKEEPRATFPKD